LLVAGLFCEKSTAAWWLISQANRAKVDQVFVSTSFFSGVEIIIFHAFDYSSLLQMFLQIDKPTS
jgi:hypothetical protein